MPVHCSSVAASRACRRMIKRVEKASTSLRHLAFLGSDPLGGECHGRASFNIAGLCGVLQAADASFAVLCFSLSGPEFTQQQLPAPLPAWSLVLFVPILQCSSPPFSISWRYSPLQAWTWVVSTTMGVMAVAHQH